MKPIPQSRLRLSVFREAARQIAEEENCYACRAIAGAFGHFNAGDNSAEEVFFNELFNPCDGHQAWYDYGYDAKDDQPIDDRPVHARVLSLLLCELLVKEGWTL